MNRRRSPWVRRLRKIQAPAATPHAIPPQIPRPPFQIAKMPQKLCGSIWLGVVITKYSRPPIRPAGKPQAAAS